MKLSVINPFNQSVIAELDYDSDANIQTKLTTAQKAFHKWRKIPLTDRIQIIQPAIEKLKSQKEKIARDVTLQMGKPLSQALGEFDTLIDRTETCIRLAEQALKPVVLPEKTGFIRRIEHEPLGVVLDIAAWNYPLIIPINVIIPALLSGNVVLLKHSAKTPLCGIALAEVFGKLEVPDLVTNLILTHNQTDQILEDHRINHVSFTGSVSGGRKVYQQAAKYLLDAGMELGGNDPAYIAEDADLDFTVPNIVDGAMYNAGQSCCAVERVYVHESLYTQFIEQAETIIRSYKLGNPLDDSTMMGPLASQNGLKELENQINDAVNKGAKLICGGKEVSGMKGYFFEPTFIINVPQDSLLMQEESFGPILPVCSVSGDEEALNKMNDTRFGLTASIWTTSQEKAERFASNLNTGTVFQNRCDYLDPELPWTGVKESGLGSTLSEYGFLNLTRRKSIHFRVEI